MTTLYDLLEKRKRLQDEMDELQVTVLSFDLSTKTDRERVKHLKKELAKVNEEINDKTR